MQRRIEAVLLNCQLYHVSNCSHRTVLIRVLSIIYSHRKRYEHLPVYSINFRKFCPYTITISYNGYQGPFRYCTSCLIVRSRTVSNVRDQGLVFPKRNAHLPLNLAASRPREFLLKGVLCNIEPPVGNWNEKPFKAISFPCCMGDYIATCILPQKQSILLISFHDDTMIPMLRHCDVHCDSGVLRAMILECRKVVNRIGPSTM